jgi:hypothetical protein
MISHIIDVIGNKIWTYHNIKFRMPFSGKQVMHEGASHIHNTSLRAYDKDNEHDTDLLFHLVQQCLFGSTS